MAGRACLNTAKPVYTNVHKRAAGCKENFTPCRFLPCYFRPFCSFAAISVFFISMAIVIGPTPPGTGVI